jgi:hypothetical protein
VAVKKYPDDDGEDWIYFDDDQAPVQITFGRLRDGMNCINAKTNVCTAVMLGYTKKK